MRTYWSMWDDLPGAQIVSVTEDNEPPRKLDPHYALANFSPDGFSAGGSGKAQLALAMLADALGDNSKAIRYYTRFKWRMEDRWKKPGAPWSITSDEIEHAIADIDAVANDKSINAERAKIVHERAPVEHEGGRGAGGGKIIWDRDEKGNEIVNPDDER